MPTTACSKSPALPEGITLTDLYHEPHPSNRRNTLLADGFYYAGIVEKWGSGTTRMARLCQAQGLPVPEFAATPYEFTVTFYKDPYTLERLQQKGLTEAQIRIVQYVQEHSSITNREVRTLLGISDESARKMLNILVDQAIICAEGQGRNLRYVFWKVGD
jgi:ATP-dependent DNA helicase RecG